SRTRSRFAISRVSADFLATSSLNHRPWVRNPSTLSAPHPADGYRIQRVLYHLRHYYTRPIYRDRPVRLFRRERGHIGGVDPHAKVIVNGRVARLRSSFL